MALFFCRKLDRAPRIRYNILVRQSPTCFPKPPYLTRIEGPPPKRNVVSSSLAGGASSEIPMTAPFPPYGENCAIMGISSLPGPTRSAGLGPGVSCELGALCLRRICDGQFRNSQDRSISALRRKLRDHGNFFASGTDSLRWTRPRGWLRTWCFMFLPYMRWSV